jgi:hypothetical protein
MSSRTLRKLPRRMDCWCNETEPAFDLVEPRGICGCVADLEARPVGQPGTHFSMLVGSVVVDDQAHIQMGGNGTVDSLQKGQKFLVAANPLSSSRFPALSSKAALDVRSTYPSIGLNRSYCKLFMGHYARKARVRHAQGIRANRLPPQCSSFNWFGLGRVLI